MAPLSRGLLDTSVLIDLGRLPAESLPDESAISSASLAELHFGVLLARTPKARLDRTRLLQHIESAYRALPIDADTARIYGSLAHALRAAGRSPRPRVMDLLIAATAVSNGLPLFTRNRRDFAGLEGFLELRPV